MADAGMVIGGKWGREILGGAQVIFLSMVPLQALHKLNVNICLTNDTNSLDVPQSLPWAHISLRSLSCSM